MDQQPESEMTKRTYIQKTEKWGVTKAGEMAEAVLEFGR